MYSSTVDCDTSSNEENGAVDVPVTSAEVEVTGTEAILVPSLSI